MLESLSPNMEMQYTKLSPEEQSKRGILGRLVGVMADFKNPTRNGRLYTEELWDKTFENPIMKEKLANRCLFGELGHPVDRQEVDMEKIAICLAEEPKKTPDGKLHGVFDILATPNGKILKTLCDYGCAIGVSSRGSGDTYEDYDGQEKVDEETFECECWDAVLVPAVKEARPKYVTESLNTRKSLKEALETIVNDASEDDKKIMKETIKSLDIDGDDSSETEVESDVSNEQEVADNDGTELVENLQKALVENSQLSKQVVALNEKLSVSYTKEVKLSEEIDNLKATVAQLSADAKKKEALSNRVSALAEKLQQMTALAEERKSLLEGCQNKLRAISSSRSSLKESVFNKDTTINTLNEQVDSLKTQLKKEQESSRQENRKLTEELSALKTDSAVKNSEYAKKLQNANKLVEKYRDVAKASIERYISAKAITLGVSPNEIKNRLSESYNFNDIDSVCESLRNYKMNMSKLPFNINGNSVQRVAMKEDTSTKRFTNPDDEIDDSLINLIKN